MLKLIHFCCFLALSLGFSALQANAATPFSLYTLSNTGLSIDNIEALGNAQWQLQTQHRLYLSAKQQDDWIKITVSNPQDETQLYFLQLSDNELPFIQAYHINAQQQYEPFYGNLGLHSRYNERPVQYRRSVYPMQIDGQQSMSLVLHIRHDYPLKIQPTLWQSVDFQRHTSRETLFFGMIYGALSMIIIYSLFVYYTLHERSYLLFLIFGLFTGLFISMQEGHFYQFIGAAKNWPRESFFALITALMCFSFTLFSNAFLELEKRSRRAMRFMLSIGSVISLFILLLGLNRQNLISSNFTLLLISLIYSSAIIIAVYIWRAKHSLSSSFFALAIGLCVMGLLADFATQLPNAWGFYNYGYASVGNTAMILVFAFALAYKMRVLQQKQIQAHNNFERLNREKAKNRLDHYIAQQKKEEIDRINTESALKNRMKNEFIATMSSEIRTPMNSILGLAELLDNAALDDNQRYLVQSINNSAKSLLNVINGLVDYSQIQTGQVSLDSRLFNLELLIDDCVSIFALQASEAKLFFTGLVNPDTPIQYRGDPDKIRQILLNILSNALHFERISGIAIRVGSHDGDKALRQTINSHELCFDIVCHNVLLTEAERNALLTPFNNQQDKMYGHQLGLTVSLELIELLQGQLKIRTVEDEQCSIISFTTRLILPKQDELQLLPEREKWLAGRRILVCDPQQAYNRSIKALTEAWGMECKTVGSSQDAISVLLDDAQAFQVLMIDKDDLSPEVQMAIRKNNVERNFTTSIVLTTRTRFAFSEDEKKKQNIQFILEKPWTTAQLYKALLFSMGIDVDENKASTADHPDIRILIAEDNNINLMVLEKLLLRDKLNIVSANDGQQALQQYQQAIEQNNAFDIIFMDCEMPVQDGYQTTKAIRELEKQQADKTLIIGLSAHTENEYRDKAVEAGMDSFITKPIDIEEINHIINGFKQKSSSND